MSERALEVSAPPERAGGASAEELVRDHFDFIWRLLRRWGLSEADADDVAQQVFLVAMTKLQHIQAGRDRAFLYGCATNLVAKWRQAQRRTQPSERLEPQSDAPEGALPRDPEADVDRSKARASLDAALATLPAELREVFVLFELEELSSVEIAQMLGTPRGTVASRLRRARQLFERQVRRQEALARKAIAP